MPKVRQVTDPILLGVHPSAPAPADAQARTDDPALERVPAYVGRDIDDELRARLAGSGFVMLVGDSTAGKSRAAYEAILTLPNHVLIVPHDRDALATAIIEAAHTRDCVLWLDDLENYLGAGGSDSREHRTSPGRKGISPSDRGDLASHGGNPPCLREPER